MQLPIGQELTNEGLANFPISNIYAAPDSTLRLDILYDEWSNPIKDYESCGLSVVYECDQFGRLYTRIRPAYHARPDQKIHV